MDLQELSTKLEGFKKSPAGYRARCPAHGGQTDALSIKIADDGYIIFHCFAGCTHKQVCDALQLNSKISTEEKPIERKYAKFTEGCSWLSANWDKFYLLDEHKQYLIKRGIDYERFNLISTDSIGLPDSSLSEAFGFTYQGSLCGALGRNRIVIPYYNHGKLISIRSRCFGEGRKYMGIRGWPSRLFRCEHRSNNVIVTEGEFKAMSCIQRDFDACGVPGIMSCHDEAVEYCKGRNATVWFDSEGLDKASRKAAEKLAKKLKGEVFEIMPHELFPGIEKMDIDEAITIFGSSVLMLYHSTALSL